jgi:hypothetical protein
MYEGDERSGNGNDEPAIYAYDVIRVWRSILAAESPWNEMPLDDIDGCMHDVLVELIDEDISPGGSRLSRLRAMAHEHGAFRRHQRCTVENLMCEFDVLRYALQICLGRSRLSVPTRRAIIAALNSEFCLVQSAVTGGWYQPAPVFKSPVELN